ncbi:MAG: glutamine--fructose-6-phosphate transaminase (isomerizing) [Bacilli bacterium]|nr:glutamine--fructose-6-phosphate transaminase (isomerizing) [Bacilli bacterium]
MCGIIGYIGSQNKGVESVLNGLEHLEYRGYDSAGIAFISDDKLNIIKEKGRIADLRKSVEITSSNLAIGHTRWATHGEVNKVNAHPHHSGSVTIVHNGIIENYIELKEELIKKGYEFKSKTDTEVACALLDYLYQKTGDIKESISEFKKKAKGAYAIGLILDNDKDNLYAIKKNSPLIIGISKDEKFIASDVPAIIDYTNKYIILEDGDYAVLNKDSVTVFDNENNKVNRKPRTFEGDALSISKCGYDHFMQKEIYEEPEVIKKTALTDIPDISNYDRICIVACGSAMHTGLVGKSLIEKYGDIPVDVEIASEFRYKKLFLDNKTLVIAISQSGETADTLEAVKIAKKMGSDTLGIINVKESSIAREVDNRVYTLAGSEIAVATTKAYAAQLEVLSKIAYSLAKNSKDASKLKEIKDYLEDLQKLPIIMQEVLDNEEEYKKVAKEIYKHKDIFFIGRGIDYALAMEGSLKLKEISYIHSEAYAAGELKHGTISLIEEQTPVIGIVSDKLIADKTISNLKEVNSRGANVIYLTTNQIKGEGDFYSTKLVVPEVNPLLQPIINVIPLQLIAYHVAKYNKCDIDKPRNLAKSVTVE